MKISIVGLHYVIQTLTLQEDTIGTHNHVVDYDLKHDDTLIDLALQLKEAGNTVEVHANFNASSLSMRALKALERKEIAVYPDLQDNNHQSIHIKSAANTMTLNDAAPLKLMYPQGLIDSDYIITNISEHDLQGHLASQSNAKIIVLDTVPTFRTLNFIDALIINETKIDEDSLETLLQNGLSWVAIKNTNSITFKTLKNSFELQLDNTNVFLSEFINALQTRSLIEWLELKKI